MKQLPSLTAGELFFLQYRLQALSKSVSRFNGSNTTPCCLLLDCDIVYSCVFSRPVPAEGFEKMIYF